MGAEHKKKILVVCQHFWPEEFKINDICKSWVTMGYEVDVLCSIPNYPLGKFFKGYSITKKRTEIYQGINIYRSLVVPSGKKNPLKILLNYVTFPIFASFKVKELSKNNYDKILIYQLTPIFMAYPAIKMKKLFGTKLYIYILDLWPESLFSVYNFRSKLYRSFFERLSKNVYKKADYILTTSKGIREKVATKYNFDKNNILYIPNWAEKVYSEPRNNIQLEETYKDTFNIVFAGNIGPAQSFNTILEAAKICLHKGYKDIKWVIVGDGMTKNWVDNRIKELKLEVIVDMLGRKPMDSMPEYYNIADALLVSLSKSNLFAITVPAKVQTYLAFGKPIIASLDGEGADIIRESKAGIACESENQLELANVVIQMYKLSEEERKLMGQNGRSYYLANFDKDKLLKKLTDFVFK